MMYILDGNGYIAEASCNHITCNNRGCLEYTGAVPEGYDSLEKWATTANIRAYKIVNGNLTYDADRDATLQAEWAKKDYNFIEAVSRMKFSTNTKEGTTVTINLGNVGSLWRNYAFFLFIAGRDNLSATLSGLFVVKLQNMSSIGTPHIDKLNGTSSTSITHAVSIDSNNNLILSVTSSNKINKGELSCICIAL